MKKNNISLTDSEKSQLDWWCRYHKESADYLAYRIIQYLDEPTESMAGILRETAEAILKQNGK